MKNVLFVMVNCRVGANFAAAAKIAPTANTHDINDYNGRSRAPALQIYRHETIHTPHLPRKLNN